MIRPARLEFQTTMKETGIKEGRKLFVFLIHSSSTKYLELPSIKEKLKRLSILSSNKLLRLLVAQYFIV